MALKPSPGARNIEEILQNFTPGFAEQRVVRACRPDQRIESIADPIHPADPDAPTRFRIPEHHQGRGRDLPKSTGHQLAAIDPLKDILFQSIDLE